MMEDLRQYDYLWNGKTSDWVLVRNQDPSDVGSYCVYNEKTCMLLLIEDARVHKAVCDRFLSAGAKVLDCIPRGELRIENLDIDEQSPEMQTG